MHPDDIGWIVLLLYSFLSSTFFMCKNDNYICCELDNLASFVRLNSFLHNGL